LGIHATRRDVNKMGRYDEIIKIIADNDDHVDFADFGDGVTEEWIQRAEGRLKIKLPESYKWWLKNYSGGEVFGEEIFSIYGMDFDTVVGGDIVYMHELNMNKDVFSDNMLVICESNDAVFYFDLSKPSEDDEYPIYEFHTKQLYARDFVEFLKRFIIEGR
jgi:hypothetical protein